MTNLKRFLICLLFSFLKMGGCVEYSSGAEYLHTAIHDIKIKNSERNILDLFENQPRIVTSPKKFLGSPNGRRRLSGGAPQTFQTQYPSAPPTIDGSPHLNLLQTSQNIPEPPSLTKGELAALYEAAVSAGHTVQMGGLPDALASQAAVHEIKDTQNSPQPHGDGQNSDSYYYYYYPLKSFLDGIPPNLPKPTQISKDHYKTPILTSYNTHMHNVKVEPIHQPEAPAKGGKALEPLFMAISSFIGMALMFVFTMVFLPRLSAGIKGPKGKGKNNIKKKGRVFPESSFFQNINWIQIVSNLIHACPNCAEHNLSPFRGLLNRFPKATSN